MFQFPGFALPSLCIQEGMTLARRVSPFRHLRIKAYCQLPVAFRRLSRLSSPVIAKASTTCTYSLDPITTNPRPLTVSCPWLQGLLLLLRLVVARHLRPACRQAKLQCHASIQSIKPSRSYPTARLSLKVNLTLRAARRSIRSLYFFQFVKEQLTRLKE